MAKQAERWESELELVPGVICVPQTVSVVITKECKNKPDMDSCQCEALGRQIKRYMSEHFDGFTKYDAYGCWVNPDNNKEECERVEVVESSHRCLDDQEGRDFVEKVLDVGHEMGEKMMFVKTDQGYLLRSSMHTFYNKPVRQYHP